MWLLDIILDRTHLDIFIITESSMGKGRSRMRATHQSDGHFEVVLENSFITLHRIIFPVNANIPSILLEPFERKMRGKTSGNIF